MLMCYVDESGDTGSLDPNERNSQPIFLISAVIVRQSALKQLTRSIIELKRQFFPSYGNGATHWHDWLKVEVKGANLRRALREGTHEAKRHVIGFMDKMLRLMESHHVQIVSRIYLKQPNAEFNGSSVYPAAVQRLEMATRAYYSDLEAVCVHADPVFDCVRSRFGQRMKALQYRYELENRKLDGVSVLAGGNRKVSPLAVFGPNPLAVTQQQGGRGA